MHPDDFRLDENLRPASKPMRLLPLIDFGRFVEQVHRFDREAAIRTLAIDGTLELQ